MKSKNPPAKIQTFELMRIEDLHKNLPRRVCHHEKSPVHVDKMVIEPARNTKVVIELGTDLKYSDADFKIIFFEFTEDELMKHTQWIVEFKNSVSQLLPIERGYLINKQRSPNKAFFVIFKNKVIGGCLFKPHMENCFLELVYLCILPQFQRRLGLGTKLLNELKIYAQREEYRHIIVYADNNALDFFKKQGFSTQIELYEKCYTNSIEHFVRAQLMGFKIHESINYKELRSTVCQQAQQLVQLITQKQESLFQYHIPRSSRISQNSLESNRVLEEIQRIHSQKSFLQDSDSMMQTQSQAELISHLKDLIFDNIQSRLGNIYHSSKCQIRSLINLNLETFETIPSFYNFL
eukprot:403371394